MLKKLAPLFLVILLAGVFFPLKSLAAGGHMYNACELDSTGKCAKDYTVCYEGIVPCGKKVCVGEGSSDDTLGNTFVTWNETKERCEDCNVVLSENPIPCQFCHFFIMIDGIIDYVLVMIVPSLTVLMLVIGGVMFYFGGAKPDLISKSKTLFKGVIIGLLLIYGAYMLVGLALTVLGAVNVNPMSEVFDAKRGVFTIDCQVSIPPAPAP